MKSSEKLASIISSIMGNMSKKVFIFSILAFSSIIVFANWAVQFNIGDTPLTYGAIAYPFSFLIMDILSENHRKEDVLRVLRIGLLIAFIPSMLLAEFRIALASVVAFFASQHIDVFAFYALKNRFPKLWWLRNNGSTMLSQFVDTMIFFHIAFLFVMPWEIVLLMAISDYGIKILLALLDTPLFFMFAIKLKNRLFA